MELIHYFDRGAYLAPGRDCFVMEEQRWSYAEAQRITVRVASALVRAGLSKGEKVAVLSRNHPVAFMCVLGIIRAQTVWVPLNPRNSFDAIVEVMQALDCECLIYESTYQPIATVAAKAMGGRLRLTVCIDKDSSEAPGLDAWLDGAADSFVIEPASPYDTVALSTTGGTTGRPKGVMQTHIFYENFIASILAVMPSPAPPRFLAAAPMTHAAGIFCFPIFAEAGTVYVLPAAKPLPIAQAIQKYLITNTILPPTVIYAMLADPDVLACDFSSLRYLWYGTAPMAPDKVKEALGIFGAGLVSGWGQSEAVCLTFLRNSELVEDGKIISEKRLASCGRKFPFMDVAVMDPEGRLLGPNETGELVTRGLGLMAGYYKDPAATAEASRFGWHHTGDVGYYDEEGFFYIVDRLKDMIISGGFNIFPSEIERVIFTHPAVEDCAVVGVPDETWGERITAIVQLKPGVTATAQDLMNLCRERLGGFKTPKDVEFWPELPRSPVGKTLKREIRDHFWSGRDRQI